ncbi:MAG: hypothetical protein WDZ93_01215 [Candidatus Paceibacterota bacterium]
MIKQHTQDPCRDAAEEHVAVRSYAERFGRGGDADVEVEAWLTQQCASGKGFSITNPDTPPS